MHFGLSQEQSMIVDTVRRFVAEELVPHEDEVERTDDVPEALIWQIRQRAIDKGLYAINMPAELGGGGLDALAVSLCEIELGHTAFALQYAVARPSNILRACTGWQVSRYLLPTIRGERVECLAMTEPGAGSDLRSMTTRARREGEDFIINGTKHFISYADVADYVVLFARTGDEGGITSFLVDKEDPGFEVRPGARASRTEASTMPSWCSRTAGSTSATFWARSTGDLTWLASGWAPPGSLSRRTVSAGPGGCFPWLPDGPERDASLAAPSAGSRERRSSLPTC